MAWSRAGMGFYYQKSDYASRGQKPQLEVCMKSLQFHREGIALHFPSQLKEKKEHLFASRGSKIKCFFSKPCTTQVDASNVTRGPFIPQLQHRIFDPDKQCPVLHYWRYLKSSQGTAVPAWEELNPEWFLHYFLMPWTKCTCTVHVHFVEYHHWFWDWDHWVWKGRYVR